MPKEAPKGIEGSQKRAMLLVEIWGEWLVINRPQIVDDFLEHGDQLTYLDLAIQYIPIAEQHPQVCSKAVAYALSKLANQADINRITSAKRARVLELTVGGFKSEAFRQHCSRAAKKKHEKGIPVDTDTLTKSRGQTPWTGNEKTDAIKMLTHIDFAKQEGQHVGVPDYAHIAKALNNMYHGGKEVRHYGSVAAFYKDFKRKNKKV